MRSIKGHMIVNQLGDQLSLVSKHGKNRCIESFYGFPGLGIARNRLLEDKNHCVRATLTIDEEGGE